MAAGGSGCGGKNVGTGERRVGMDDRRIDIVGAEVGTNAEVGANVEWEDISERRVGINDRRDGINDGSTVGMDGYKGGINGDMAGIDVEWDDLREKRVGINDRRVGINDDNNVSINNGGNDEKVGINNGRVGINLSQNQQNILGCIAENQHVTMTELSAAVGISTRKIEANVQKLKAMGLLERVGARKNGYWVLTRHSLST